MANNRKTGVLGLSIPVINPSTQHKINWTPEVVIKWRASLPMADTGASAKKMYMALSELNNTELLPAARFEIIEQLRVPLKSICTTLKKHYIEQRKPLNERQLMIANLRQSLLTEMADNYKTILEQLGTKDNLSNEEKVLLPTVICRILYYFNAILICRYQIYSYIPVGLWTEVHLLYKYAKKLNLLKQKVKCIFSKNHELTTILTSYLHIILLSATDPYQWRQAEQHSLNKMIGIWPIEPTIYEHPDLPSKKIGIYVIDLNKDESPISYGFKADPTTNSCVMIDLSNHVQYIKDTLAKIEENERKTKIQHYGNPEFGVTKPTLKKLIKIWSMEMTRSDVRLSTQGNIKIAFGLIAAHYYLNSQKEFNPHLVNVSPTDKGKRDTGPALISDLPTFEVDEGDDDEEAQDEISLSTLNSKNNSPSSTETNKIFTPDKEELYHLYDYFIEDMSPHGLCISIKDGSLPPFHAGEIVIFNNTTKNNSQWGIGAVRWLKRKNDALFQIGIQLISPTAKAAGFQMFRDDKPLGHLLRCLVLPSIPDLKLEQSVVLATSPFHSNKILLYIDTNNNDAGIETTLTSEIESTDMYYQYTYTTPEVVKVAETTNDVEKNKSQEDDEQTNTEFDSIWKDL